MQPHRTRRHPHHPGAYVAHHLAAAFTDPDHLAKSLGITQQQLSALIAGKLPVDAELAARLGAVLGQRG
jgi:plasmid maintenance system antidote protein VapI